MSHAECLQSLDVVRLVALCDTDRSALVEGGARLGINGLFSDYRELISSVRPDLLSIATRTPAKKQVFTFACENGVRAIYIEKPLANSTEDCRELLDLARDRRVKIAYGVNRRYHAAYRLARDLVRQGEIGELVDIVVEHGRSPLLWAHPHLVDLMLFFSGSTGVSDVQATLAPESVQWDSDLTVDSDPLVEHAFFRFANGVSGVIGRTPGLSVRLGGVDGTLTIHGNGHSLQLSRRSEPSSPYFWEQQFRSVAMGSSATVTAMRELAASIVDDLAPPISPREIEVGTRMLLGCVWSHLQGGRRVTLDEVPKHLTVTGRSGNLYA